MPNDNPCNRAGEIFAEACQLQEPERSHFVTDACGADQNLRREVESLLADDELATREGFLSPPLPNLGDVSADLADPWIGKRLGQYQITRRIGHGGMGNVYLALRTSDFETQVAIKLIRGGAASELIVDRFRNEMRVMAALSRHANIASLIDAGTTDDGQPFFIMEYVDGQRIDAYCDEQRLDVPDRLALFQLVANAIQFAHQNAVLHRDLKPSNILVTAEGTPKLIDFGIAKLTETNRTDGGESGDQPETGTLLRALTPEYASPEQIQGQPLTCASDVYSAGVVLYELLCGQRPFRFKDLTPVEVERVICDTDPRKPSDAVALDTVVASTGTPANPSTPAMGHEVRATSARQLRKVLAGDLDRIVLQALHKDVHRRYQTAAELSADIYRFLNDQPIAASSDSLIYRGRKFIKRNKLLVSGLATLATLLVAWAGTATILTMRARHAEYQERQQRLVAERNENTANRVVELFESMFDATDPRTSRGKEPSLRSILDAHGPQWAEQLKDEPVVEARLLKMMGKAYYGQGAFEQALDKQKRSHELRAATLGKLHPDSLALGNDVGRSLIELGRYDEAERVLTAALANLRQVCGDHHRETLRAELNLGVCLAHAGRFEEAEPLLLSAHQGFKQEFGESHSYTRVALGQMVIVRFNQGRLAEAEEIVRQDIQAEIAARGSEEHLQVLVAQANLAAILAMQEKYMESAEVGEKVVATSRRLLGDTHAYTLRWIRDLAQTQATLNNLKRADELFGDWFGGWSQQHDDFYPQVIDSILLWGTCLRQLEKYEEAAQRLRQGYDYYCRHHGPADERVAPIRAELQTVYRAKGQEQLAEALEPIPPETPSNLLPQGRTVVETVPIQLQTSPFKHAAGSSQHVRTHWQVRAENASYQQTPTLDITSSRNLTRFPIPRGLLLPDTEYSWRVAHIASNLFPSSASAESSFRTPNWPDRFESIDLSAQLNCDIIANPGDVANDALDGDADGMLLVAGYDGKNDDNPSVHGVPAHRQIGPHRLADFDGRNALQLVSSDSRTVRVSVQRQCLAVRLLVTGGNGTTDMPLTLEYSDGTADNLRIICPDWFEDDPRRMEGLICTPLINGMDRLRLGEFDDCNDPALFDVLIPVRTSNRLHAISFNPGRAEFDQPETTFILLAISALTPHDER